MIRYAVLAVAMMTVAATCAAQTAAPTGDPARGQDKTRMCEGCHGLDGYRTAYPVVYSVPRIGGQHPEYLAQALHEYRDGQRSHPSMRAIAASLSDQDIADLAAYYGQSGKTMASK
ncbi:MAG: c-type cytochrome [Casimicrobiaceae bacterium]